MTFKQSIERLAIITGAAGGMGAPSAVRLSEQGWSLILCDIDPARLEVLASSLRAPGRQIDVLAASIADSDFSERLLTIIADRTIGAVIHTAGLSPTMGTADDVWTVNYDATVGLVDLIRPRMAAGACAVLIASSSAYAVTQPELLAAIDALADGDRSDSLRPLASSSCGAAYSVSKRAVIRLVERQAAAFGAVGARIMSISPGLIDTAMGRAEQKAHVQMDHMLAKAPAGRYGTGDEIASVAVFLCSPDASYLSGSDVKVDGGVLAAMSY